MRKISLISWNVNGLRAAVKKGFMDFIAAERPDIIGIQETKLQADQIPDQVADCEDYSVVWNFAERKGYSGTALFCRTEPLHVKTAFPSDILNAEGRVIEAEFPEFTLLNIYFPNGQMSEDRLKYKLKFYDECLEYCESLRRSRKKVLIMGDFNTAHREIDLENPKSNETRSGFLPIERQWLDRIFSMGYVDTFRSFNSTPGQYTWWSYRFSSRAKNIGWRIDYFVASPEMSPYVADSVIMPDIQGSDHCPIKLHLNI